MTLAGSAAPAGPSRPVVTTALGVTLILAWGSSYYLLTVLAGPIAEDTGWPLAWVVSGLSLGLLISGLCAPFVGRTVQRHGGRPVLAASSLLFAAGLAGLAAAPSLAAFLAAWVVMGAGASTGLYDAAFATAGRLWGREARSAITALTLWGGFASTVCWPLSAWLVEAHGWRGACWAYAALHLAVGLPLHLWLIPHAEPEGQQGGAPIPPAGAEQRNASARAHGEPHDEPGHERTAFVLLAAIITFTALAYSMVSVHLLALLELRGLDLAAAVALGALLGPAQVAARAIDMVAGRRLHPFWTMIGSLALIAAGLALLLAGLPVPALAVVLYGAGNGLNTIARGALPLALFDPGRYAVVVGRLARPSLIIQALAPTLGVWLLVGDGTLMLGVLTAAVLTALGLCLVLARWSRREE